MQHILLGRSTCRVSRLGYGCWRLAGSEGVETPTEPAEGIRAVLAAADSGITLFDLADVYGGGRCEELFGAALRERPGLRNELVVAGKCGIRRAGVPSAISPYRYDSSAAHIVVSVEASLKRMGIETLDVLMLHRPDFLMEPDEVAGAFVRLHDGGKVREFGVSNFLPTQFSLLQQACPMPLVVHQVEISLAQSTALEDGTLDQCLASRMTPLAWSPLARGALVPTPGAPRGALTDALIEAASARGVTPAAIALAWLLRHPAGIVPLIGSIRASRIWEAVAAIEVPMDREEWYRLLTAARDRRLP
ncbi:MAG: aldo/keto reductase [Verrucomicrobiae bacterium]|nr:aldo/keto reductase [Verrucomicrobiae bacterium]